MSHGNEGGGLPPLSASDELDVRMGHAAEQAIEDITAAESWILELEHMHPHKHGGWLEGRDTDWDLSQIRATLQATRIQLMNWINEERGP